MKIKAFVFPTFEEWVQKSKEARVEVGAYRCEIRAFSWFSGSCKAIYMFAVSFANTNPLNVYTSKLFCRSFEYDGDIEELKKWYYNTINSFQNFWENYVKTTYLDDDK